MEKPLPDRIRPLEGAGLYNMMSGAESHGFERRREWRIAGPACAVIVAVVLAWLVLAW